MLAYQVCECTRSAPPRAAAIARSTPKRAAAPALALGERRVRLGRRWRLGAVGAEAVDVDVDQLAQLADQEVDVDPAPP